ncbi:MAG: undecaprenyl-phosphate glucose phosphotransferase [Pseudomonadota bacterium]|nr:undecaprenyl-phosphate glucose phosphotransferase [Pseudomonadota bacterium]
MTHSQTGIIREHQSRLAFLYRISDSLIILAALYLSAGIYGIPWTEHYLIAGVLAMILFYIAAESVQLYRSWRGVPLRQQVQPLAVSWVMTTFSLLVIAYMTKTTGTFSRVAIGAWMISVPVVLILWRAVVNDALGLLRANGRNSRRVAIAGDTGLSDRLVRMIRSDPTLGMRFAGLFDDSGTSDGRASQSTAASPVGNLEDLVQRAKEGEFDLIYIALPLRAQERISALISELSDTAVTVYLVPDLFVFDLLHSRLVCVGDLPTISVYESPFFGIEGWIKRLEDVLLSGLILVLIAVPMLLIAVGVKLSSPGPVLFKQRRYGLDGRRILVWKFRTMRVCEDGDKVIQARKADCRVTPFGAFLRRSSLDELPQFFNVLLGDMSVVGPRPHAVAHNEQYRTLISGYMLRHKVKPGITGWAQVNGWRGETDTLDKMKRRIDCDLWYIRSWSLWLDVKIILRTMLVGFVGRNAY